MFEQSMQQRIEDSNKREDLFDEDPETEQDSEKE